MTSCCRLRRCQVLTMTEHKRWTILIPRRDGALSQRVTCQSVSEVIDYANKMADKYGTSGDFHIFTGHAMIRELMPIHLGDRTDD